MGIVADSLEKIREMYPADAIDPCLIALPKKTDYNNEQIKQQLAELSKLSIGSERRYVIRQELMINLSELKRNKVIYLVSEKAIYEIQNLKQPSTMLVNDIIKEFLYQLHQAYNEVCNLIEGISRKIDAQQIPDMSYISDDDVRQSVLNCIVNSVLMHMSNCVIADSAEFRKVVTDCANMIRCIGTEKICLEDRDKTVFSRYLENHFEIQKDYHKCSNCGKPLYKDVPYCLNCYERNM